MMKGRSLVAVGLVAVGLAVLLLLLLLKREDREPSEMTLYGNVDIRQVDLGFRVDGRIETLLLEEGEPVEAGTLVATLENEPYMDLLKETEANAAAVEASLVNAEILYKRRLQLSKSGAVSKEELDDAISTYNVLLANLEQAVASIGVARKNLDDTKVFAPTDGSILTRIKEPGSVVRAGEAVCTVSIKQPLWIRAYVSEPQLGLIYPDMPAEIYTDTKGSKAYVGHIGFISPVAEFTPKTVETTELRTDLVYRLRVVVDDADERLRQGMPVTVKLKLKGGASAPPRIPRQ